MLRAERTAWARVESGRVPEGTLLSVPPMILDIARMMVVFRCCLIGRRATVRRCERGAVQESERTEEERMLVALCMSLSGIGL